ncbi:MAG: hypothetical protein ACK4UN_10035 [Limisphaerales bacterium]
MKNHGGPSATIYDTEEKIDGFFESWVELRLAAMPTIREHHYCPL